MADKMKYEVVDGKHDLGEDPVTKTRSYAVKGQVVDLTAEEAAKFPGKFRPVVVQAKAAEAE